MLAVSHFSMGFAPVPLQLSSAPVQRSTGLVMGVESMEGIGPETADKVFDPYGLSKMGSDKTLAWFRHAEIKHGRVAMAAITGLLFHINHIHFSGMLSPTFGVSFESLSNMGPFDAWNSVPLLGQMQIIFTIAGLEHASECLDPAGHYTKGGTPGNLKFLKVCVSAATPCFPCAYSSTHARTGTASSHSLAFFSRSLLSRTSGTRRASRRSSLRRSLPRSVRASLRMAASP